MGANQSSQSESAKRGAVLTGSFVGERKSSTSKDPKRSLTKATNKELNKSPTNVAAKLGLSWRKRAPFALSRQENNIDADVAISDEKSTSGRRSSAKSRQQDSNQVDQSFNHHKAPHARKSLASVFDHLDGRIGQQSNQNYDTNNNRDYVETDIHNERAVDISGDENRSSIQRKYQQQNGRRASGVSDTSRNGNAGIPTQQNNGSYYVPTTTRNPPHRIANKSNDEICVTIPAANPKHNQQQQVLLDTQQQQQQQYLGPNRYVQNYTNGGHIHPRGQQNPRVPSDSSCSSSMLANQLRSIPNGATIHAYYYGNNNDNSNLADDAAMNRRKQQHQLAHSANDPYCHSRSRSQRESTTTVQQQQPHQHQRSQLDGCPQQLYFEAKQQQFAAHNGNNHHHHHHPNRITTLQHQQQPSSLHKMPTESGHHRNHQMRDSINGPYDIVVQPQQTKAAPVQRNHQQQQAYQLSHAITSKTRDLIHNHSGIDKISDKNRLNMNHINNISNANDQDKNRRIQSNKMMTNSRGRVTNNGIADNRDDYGFDSSFADSANVSSNRPLSLSQFYSPHHQESTPIMQQQVDLNDSYGLNQQVMRNKSAISSGVPYNQTNHHQRVPSSITTASQTMSPAYILSPPAQIDPLFIANAMPHHYNSSTYNRSYSIGSSLTLDSSKSKRNKKNSSSSINPFAGLFGGNNSTSSKSNSNRFAAQANTIHLGSNQNRYTSPQQHHQASKSMLFSTTSSSSNGQRSAPGSLKRIKASNVGTLFGTHQASHEAMRTIDMYLIRQIARSVMDFDMEQRIDLEIRLHELAAQSMLEARNEVEALEVEKSMLASEQRMNCYAAQLEERRKLLSSTTMSTTSGDSGRGSKINIGSDRSKTRRDEPQSTRRSDVIGDTTGELISPAARAIGAASSSSPSQFSSLSAQSPSKLSPVFDQSANSPSSSSQLASTSANDNSSNSSNSIVDRNSRLRIQNKSTDTSNNDNSHGRQLRRTTNVRKSRQNKRQEQGTGVTNVNNIIPNGVTGGRVTISISEMRIPLMWRDVDHFKNRGDYKRYAVFCLLKIDSQIYDTQLISDVDRHITDVNFDDVITFNNIEHNFELTIEVYSCLYLEQFSFSSTPRKLKEKLSNSVSRAMGRRLATQTASTDYIKELQAYDRSHRFALIATAKLKSGDASDSVKTYDFKLISPSAHNRHQTGGDATSPNSGSDPANTNNNGGTIGSRNGHSIVSYYSYNYRGGTSNNANSKEAQRNTLPLFGHFCCRLYLQADVHDKKAGY